MITLNEAVTKDFTTENPLTGQVQDADVLPTCEIFEQDTDIAILAPAVVKRVGHLGNYRFTFTTDPVLGFEVGKSYNAVVQATVAGITAKARVSSFNIAAAIAAVGGGGFSI